MIRLTLGFILGVTAAYYTAPSLKSPFKDFEVSSITQLFQSDGKTHSSNTFNSMSPAETYALNNRRDVSAQVRTAITLISTRDLGDQTSVFAVNLITDLIEHEPRLQQYVHTQISDGITNKEALDIFEKYYSL
jgi:hypothetical protein